MERFLPQKKRFCVVILIIRQERLLGIGNREKALEKPVRGNQEWDDNSRVSLLGGPHLCALVSESTTSTCFVLFFLESPETHCASTYP